MNEKESLREEFRACLLFHLHTPDQSQHEVDVNVRLSVLESYTLLAIVTSERCEFGFFKAILQSNKDGVYWRL